MKDIYLVEDHLAIRESVERYLNLSGYNVSSFSLIKTAEVAIREKEPDLLIQDVMLPDGDGFLFIKKLRQEYNFPVIFMTARGSESDRITGFELGGDDYIVKPFSPKELVLRVEAILRRVYEKNSKPSEDGHYISKDSTLKFNISDHSCFVDDKEIYLTAAEWKILELLIKNNNSLVTRETILKECFNYTLSSYDRIVDTHIKNIRSKLAKGNNIWIETVRGYGYKFIGEEVK
jgi:DNA-binding response OmpR family regulator